MLYTLEIYRIHNIMQLTIAQLRNFFDSNLAEDLGIGGDITSWAALRSPQSIDFTISTRQDAIICGIPVSEYFFHNYSQIKFKQHCVDGDLVKAGGTILSGSGDAHEILKLERTILNYLQHLSGIATLTRMYVDAASGTVAKICDTRKTLPGLRTLQKYAVTCGGGNNHRYALDSGILVKDNHIRIAGGITEVIHNIRKYAPHYSRIEVECDTIEQVQEALAANVDVIMLDNMDLAQIKSCVALINGSAKIDVSGGVSLENAQDIARTGVDYISVGRLTHSAPSVDIGLDI